ncbi:hypothetical protein EYF80_042544 [Liparis tanakae]|uniref:Uncharacterized protein n=1 Tax=Liparis tanakae TaxID=230148 RepID=A0A4Z2G150_9TELE|nr:hypothetical protein EYF80_042544 [Liparis tanakae]
MQLTLGWFSQKDDSPTITSDITSPSPLSRVVPTGGGNLNASRSFIKNTAERPERCASDARRH